MGTKKEPVGEKGAARRKLKLNKETVKDLTVKDGAGQRVRGAAWPSMGCSFGCTFPCTVKPCR